MPLRKRKPTSAGRRFQTVSDFAECTKKGNCTDKDLDAEGFCNGKLKKPDHPINCVDWDQAEAYCGMASKRLPTLAEWTWAARDGEGELGLADHLAGAGEREELHGVAHGLASWCSCP